MSATCISNYNIDGFDLISDKLLVKFNVIAQLTEICGARWSYLRGSMPDFASSITPAERIRLSDNLGLILYNADALPEAIRNNLKDDVLSSIDGEIELDKSEIVEFLETEDESRIQWLFDYADCIRKKYVGDEVHIRGIIEFSNYCRKDCLYCGLRASNKDIDRYRLDTDQIFSSADNANKLGYKTVVLQCGEDKAYNIDELCLVISRIKKELDLAITLSLGELEKEEYRKLKDAGADRYLLRFETTDPILFKKLKPTCDYDKRFTILKWLREMGYQVGSGIMIGLPGQTAESIADDILMFKALDLDMVGNGPFISNPQTPLEGAACGDLVSALKLVALTRIVTKNAHIPATTALGTIHPQGRQKAFSCGANVIMPNVTPSEFRKYYLLYPNKICIDEKPSDCSGCIRGMLSALSRTVSKNHGHSFKMMSDNEKN